MAIKEKEKEDQADLLEIIETDDNGKPLAAAPEAADKETASDKGDDARMSPDAEDDKEIDTPSADPEVERYRAAKRERRKRVKEMRREKQINERQELEELRRITAEQAHRLRAVEVAQTGNMEQTLRERLQRAVQLYEAADRDVGLSIEAGDGNKAREAMQARDDAKDAAQNFDQQLRRIKAPPTGRVGPDPQEARLYQDWIAKNDWYDPNQGNEESRLAMEINQTLLREGYRPNTPAFWEQLSSRSDRFIKPTKRNARNDDDDDDRPARARGGPPVGGSGREAAPNGKLQVFVTPARRKALEEAGKWDDVAERNKMLRRYAEHDRNNSTNAR